MKPYISNISEEERRALLACIAVFVNEGCHSVHGSLDDSKFKFPARDVTIDDLVFLLYPEETDELIDILNTL